MNDDVKNILEKIQELNNEKIKVKIPSSGKSTECELISFKQQKDILGTVGDGVASAVKLEKVINSILIENTKNDSLTVVDKLLIILKLRSASISDSIERNGNKIPLSDVIEKVEKIKVSQSSTISHDQVEVDLVRPTLKNENRIIQASIDALRKDDDLGKSVGDLFTFEIVKVIDKVRFGELELIFNDIPIKDRYTIVEKLPLSLNKKIVEFIQELNEKNSECLTVNTDNGEYKLEVDVAFFNP